jgi:UDP-GlcNAc:undecaprenyl-phosphate GlcNAc-1-phosphate transferase
MHLIPTPTLGGLAIVSGVLIVSPFLIPWNNEVSSYFASSALIFLLGIIDDVRGASWRMKLGFSVLATSIFMIGSGMWIHSLGNLFGLGEIELGIWGISFTFFAVFGVMNAINLIDGLNGLACGVSSIAFMALAIFASSTGNSTVCLLSLANLGATLGLFKYNYPKASIFMGDSGSLFLGYSFATLSIMLTQGEGDLPPMIPVLIMGIPIFDTLRVMAFRILKGRHPFHADRTHIHHVLIRSRIRRDRVVNVIWGLSGFMAVLAFVLRNFGSWVIFYAFLTVSVILSLWLYFLPRIVRWFNR